MNQWSWIALAAVALGAFYFLSKGGNGVAQITMQNDGEGEPAEKPFGGAPAKSDSWIEYLESGVSIAKDGAEFLKGIGVFEYDSKEGGAGFKLEW